MACKWYDVDMNNSKNRAMYGKQRAEDLKAMFLARDEEPIEPEPEIKESTFSDDFETGWTTEAETVSKFGELFEIDWFMINSYTNITSEEFDDNWFTNNNFIIVKEEDFEDESWD